MRAPAVDHLVYAVPDLDAAIDELEHRLGVRPMPGGKHAGLGTHNALLALGEGAYLEAIAPDPDQPAPARPRPFGLDTLRGPRLVTWAARVDDVDGCVDRARAAGYDPGQVVPLARDRPDGARLQWRLTMRQEAAGDGLVPFLIDWGTTTHPSRSAPAGCLLLALRAEHPRPDPIRQMLRALEVDLDVSAGPEPALIALLDTPRGRVEL